MRIRDGKIRIRNTAFYFNLLKNTMRYHEVSIAYFVECRGSSIKGHVKVYIKTKI
jgi:hypothetical protein